MHAGCSLNCFEGFDSPVCALAPHMHHTEVRETSVDWLHLRWYVCLCHGYVRNRVVHYYCMIGEILALLFHCFHRPDKQMVLVDCRYCMPGIGVWHLLLAMPDHRVDCARHWCSPVADSQVTVCQ